MSEPNCTLGLNVDSDPGRGTLFNCAQFFPPEHAIVFNYAVSCQAASGTSASPTDCGPKEQNVFLSRSYHRDALALCWPVPVCGRTNIDPTSATPARATECRQTECGAGS